MDPTRQKWTRINLNRHNFPTPTIDGIRGHRARRHQYSNDTLHHRAKTMGTIRRDLPARRCVPPNSGLLATRHLLRRDITSDARNPPNLSRKPTYPSGIRRRTLLPLSRHLPRKFLSQHWLQLIAIIFCRQAKIRLLNRYTYAFENPTTVLEALSTVHGWSCTNLGNRPLRRTVWQDRKAILDHLTPSQDNQNTVTGKLLTTHPKVKPNYFPWITYAETDILQARGTVVICCPADLLSHSAMARYVIREYGQEENFKRRPAVGKAIQLAM